MPALSHRRAATPLLAVVLLVGTLIACSSNSSGSDQTRDDTPAPELRAEPTDDGFELTWTADEEPRIQVEVQTPQDTRWETTQDWTDIEVGHSGDRHLYDDVEVQHRYRFRIHDPHRDQWSEPVGGIWVETTLPVIRLRTDDGKAILEEKRPYRSGHLTLESTGDHEGFASAVKIRGRGNSTWKLVDEKKSYQLKFDDSESLLGMPAARRWVLLANYFDPSQLRNYTAMQISRTVELEWTPDMTWVELYLNDTYAGIYVLSEKIETSPDHLDLEPPGKHVTDGPELTGDYLLQIDWFDRSRKAHWDTPHNVHIALQRPKIDDSNKAQFDYIRDYVDAFENALHSEDFTNPETGYRRYLDVESFIDSWIVQELTMNRDAYMGSTFFYKKRNDPKLYFGPAWDFDISMGSTYNWTITDDVQPIGTTQMRWHTTSEWAPWDDHDIPALNRGWAWKIFDDPWFQDQVSKRWHQVRPALEQVPEQITTAATQLENARAHDLLRWIEAKDEMIEKRNYADVATAEENTAEFLADWLQMRIDWMTENIDHAADGS